MIIINNAFRFSKPAPAAPALKTERPDLSALSPSREAIHEAIAAYVERCPEHIEPKPYRATLCYAASTCLRAGGEHARIYEAADALTRGRDAGAVWFDWHDIYCKAKRGGLDAVLEKAGGDPWGFLGAAK